MEPLKSFLTARAQLLRAVIEEHNHRYYVLDAPTISDAAFDRLFNELLTLESKYPDLITPDSPTQRVGGAPAEAFGKVHYTVPMLSLEKVHSFDEARAWGARVEQQLDKT